jgi:uncharacterized protein YcnI/copper(I)-binding protein
MKLVHASAFAVLSFIAISSPAFAHSTLETQQAVIGSGYKGVVRLPHGCGEQATHTVRVTLPQEIVAAKPMPKASWKLETKQGPYARPYDNHGKTMHEGVREIIWSGGNLPNEHYDEFVFTGTIAPAAEPGTIYVPVVQECAAGSERWIEILSGSEPNARLKYPAPKLTLVQNAQKVAQAHSHAPAAVAEYTAGPLKITAPWTRATPKGAQVGGGYLKITNTGKEADRLVGGTLPIAGRFEVHEMSNEGGMMKMRHLPQGLEIKPGATVELKPGGYHLMFMQLKEPLFAGKSVKGTLVFEKSGTVEIEYSVAPIGAREMPASGGHGGHSHH